MGFNPNELKAARIRRGITQKVLAEKLKTTPANYCMKENGARMLYLNDANRIAEVLDLSSSEIEDIFFAKGFNSKGKIAKPTA